MKKLYITTDRGSKFAGNFDPKRNEFIKEVEKSKHLFRKYQAFGLDRKLLADLADKKTRIRIWEKEERKWYETDAIEFLGVGHVEKFGNGGNEQVFLPLSQFKITEVPLESREATTERLLRASIL